MKVRRSARLPKRPDETRPDVTREILQPYRIRIISPDFAILLILILRSVDEDDYSDTYGPAIGSRDAVR